MNESHEFPLLYGVDKNGKEKVWQARVMSRERYATSIITYGQTDGKKTIATRDYTTGKNVGKANETTPYQQCIQETERKWKDKIQKENYSQQPSSTPHTILPMLASTYSTTSTKRNDIRYPCQCQPKLDGLRCLMYMKEGTVHTQSRTGGVFESLSYLSDAMRPVFTSYPDLIVDGELYTMDIPFETLTGLIKKKHLTDTDRDTLRQHVKYHVYDLVSDEPFLVRNQRIRDMEWPPYVVVVDTFEIQDVDECKARYAHFVEQGYEGIMLRNTDGMYRTGFRSHDLQKYKEFQDQEYPIFGVEEGEGRDKGCVIWVCRTPEGKSFRVRPRGSLEQRKTWFEQGDRYIGTPLTVIFQELSEQGVPRFPVGKALRDGY